MTRVLSAAVLGGLLYVTIWYLPSWATAAMALAAAALGGWELARMAAQAGAAVPAVFVASAALVLAAAFLVDARVMVGGSGGALAMATLALVVAAGVISLSLGAPGPSTLPRAAVLVMAPVYVGLPLGAIAWVQWVRGPGPLTWLLVIVAVSDSSQYYAGRRFGRLKLAPAVSPAKTREGAVGGLIGAAIAGGLLARLWLPQWPVWTTVVVAIALAIFGMAGDLFESLLKRGVGVKDSSALIPGHGGILDRIDSHLFAAPVFYLFVRWLG